MVSSIQSSFQRNPKCIHSIFPLDPTKVKWVRHRAIEKLEQVLNLTDTCGYITFVNIGVPDIGCEQYDINVHLRKPRARSAKEKKRDQTQPPMPVPTPEEILVNILLFHWKKGEFHSLYHFNSSMTGSTQNRCRSVLANGRIRNHQFQYCEKDVDRWCLVEIARWKSFCHNARKSISVECIPQRRLQWIAGKRAGQTRWNNDGRIAWRSIQSCVPVVNWNRIFQWKGFRRKGRSWARVYGWSESIEAATPNNGVNHFLFVL